VTEAEWLACTNPVPMLDFLRGKTSDRKLRLAACAFLRRVLMLLTDEDAQHPLFVAERFADDEASETELSRAYDTAGNKGCCVASTHGYTAAYDSCRAACHAAVEHARAAKQAVEPASLNAVYFAEQQAQPPVIRDIFNPFVRLAVDPSWLAWNDAIVVKLAQGIYDDRAFDRLPILADALEDAGCAETTILDHLRSPGPHARGCWPLDLILGKQ
jgi:hypothetical protein